jgi:hypothetical protein
MSDLKQTPGPKAISEWLQAAEYARKQIAFHKKRIRRLKEAVRNFEELDKTGERWPGDSAKEK